MGVQVQRLLQRDRKELTGVEEIGASFRAEFDDGREGAAGPSGEGGASANGAGSSPSSAGSPFGAGPSQPCLRRPFLHSPAPLAPAASLPLRPTCFCEEAQAATRTRDARVGASIEMLSGHCEQETAEHAGCSLHVRASA